MSGCNCNGNHDSPSTLLSNPDALRKDLSNAKNQGFAFDENTTHALVSICINATANNRRICFDFPIVGTISFNPGPLTPDGPVHVCASTCGFKYGTPPFTGIKASVFVGQNESWAGTVWGTCS